MPPFGPLEAPLLIAGLAPGLKGANASGRPFTGDGAGPLLYGTLTALGLASRRESVLITDHPSTIRAGDGLQLHGCRISNAVKCLPPDNKPLPTEIRTCNRFIAAEIEAMPNLRVIVALGKVAHDAVLMALGRKASAGRFAHAEEHQVGGYTLIDSYHCSRYNQNTGRLTAPMFRAVFDRAVQLVR
ncbi:MAG: uracil-DNA glycosylase [Thiomonas sp.]